MCLPSFFSFVLFVCATEWEFVTVKWAKDFVDYSVSVQCWLICYFLCRSSTSMTQFLQWVWSPITTLKPHTGLSCIFKFNTQFQDLPKGREKLVPIIQNWWFKKSQEKKERKQLVEIWIPSDFSFMRKRK